MSTVLLVLVVFVIMVVVEPVPAVYLYLRLRHGKHEAALYMWHRGIWPKPKLKSLGEMEDD